MAAGRLQLVVATANPHKLSEIAAILGSAVELVARPTDMGDVDENGATLEANARLKATAVCSHTGQPAVADDTGLEVAALAGAPGVRSARYGGEDATDAANRELLLANLQGITDRSAQFCTVALVVYPDGSEVVAVGITTGHICDFPRGDNGFGYDSVFVPTKAASDGKQAKTFAEMTAADKNALSHRGKAFRALATKLGV
ncbi:MAG: RdgB/HAM1 family non-canonical purine NTP pyrophosphatase [bacterium]|nr:RdgB/HAM1 family non-canonical purine NTP pyrophosphatase [bacterium]